MFFGKAIRVVIPPSAPTKTLFKSISCGGDCSHRIRAKIGSLIPWNENTASVCGDRKSSVLKHFNKKININPIRFSVSSFWELKNYSRCNALSTQCVCGENRIVVYYYTKRGRNESASMKLRVNVLVLFTRRGQVDGFEFSSAE